MCLAIPMEVLELKNALGDGGGFLTAVVDAEGIQKEVRLDVVPSMPAIGDYVIVHAGFAIQTLDREEAQINLKLLQQMAEDLDRRSPKEPS